MCILMKYTASELYPQNSYFVTTLSLRVKGDRKRVRGVNDFWHCYRVQIAACPVLSSYAPWATSLTLNTYAAPTLPHTWY